jgi:hypothetical protein
MWKRRASERRSRRTETSQEGDFAITVETSALKNCRHTQKGKKGRPKINFGRKAQARQLAAMGAGLDKVIDAVGTLLFKSRGRNESTVTIPVY